MTALIKKYVCLSNFCKKNSSDYGVTDISKQIKQEKKNSANIHLK